MGRIPVAGPWITEKEAAYVAEAASNAWYANATLYHQRFETAFAAYQGVRFAIALPSCTSAIHLALLALGIGPGDEVIVPEATWIASSAPLSYVGAVPVFADIDPRTWCLSVESLESLITTRTKAVIPVDLYGNLPQMVPLRLVAERHGLAIIEDAAQAIGSEYDGRKAGSWGDCGVFSFNGTKTLTTGEGGMLITDREDVYARAQVLRDHGRRPDDTKMFWNAEVAHKYRMSALQAALGLAQLERIEELVARKREIHSWYRRELAAVSGLTLNVELSGTKNTFWMTTVILDERHGLPKEAVIEALRERGIDCRPFFYPLSSLPAYAALPGVQRARERNPVSYRLCPYGVNLPSAMTLTEDQVVFVCDALKGLLE